MAAAAENRPPFADRLRDLPRLGLGISTEYGAGSSGLDVLALARSHPDLVRFLEIGADLERGVDEAALAWVNAGFPTTYHFLDLNLENPEDLDPQWCRDTADLARRLGAAWLCGDAGLWYVGPRDLGHGTLVPPILIEESASAMAANLRRAMAWTDMEILPENPPAHVFLGDLHLIEYYRQVADQADCGLLLDVSHLAGYQIVQGHDPLHGLERLPFERVVEIHLAGGRRFEHQGRSYVDDDHGVNVLDESWQILEHLLPRCQELRALVLECERNSPDQVVPLFEGVRDLLVTHRSPLAAASTSPRDA